MKSRLKKLLMAGAALAAFALGGSALAGAATTASTGNTGATGATTTSPPMRANFPAPGSAAHEDSETAVTGADATKAQAAAVASVGSGTAGSVTTNCDKTGYEVTVTKADGSTVEVHMDLSFNVQTMPAGGGPGRGGPGPQSSSAGPLA
jgi:hypothetical protein